MICSSGTKTHPELTTTQSPWGQRGTQEQGEMLCHQFKPCSFHQQIPAQFLTAESMGIHHTTSYTTSGKKKTNSAQRLLDSLLHNETGSRICFKRQLRLAGSTALQDEPCSYGKIPSLVLPHNKEASKNCNSSTLPLQGC